MQWRNAVDRFGIVAQSLHWVIVAGLVASYFLAEAAEDNETGSAMGLHRSIGIAILALAILRLLWRLVDRRPAWPTVMPGYQRIIARATHAIFYVLLFALPITGWMISSVEGDPVPFFGLFELPPIPSGADEHWLEDLHEMLFNVLLGFAVLHVIGALKHHFWDRDGVLRSMLPGRKPQSRKHPGAGG
jgi:cytochrome b561